MEFVSEFCGAHEEVTIGSVWLASCFRKKKKVLKLARSLNIFEVLSIVLASKRTRDVKFQGNDLIFASPPPLLHMKISILKQVTLLELINLLNWRSRNDYRT